jgi:hypothetical protein
MVLGLLVWQTYLNTRAKSTIVLHVSRISYCDLHVRLVFWPANQAIVQKNAQVDHVPCAIQLAKHLGATVATTTSAKNADLVRQLGADVVIDYKAQDFETVLSGYDLVLNSQDTMTLEKSLRILKPGGWRFPFPARPTRTLPRPPV